MVLRLSALVMAVMFATSCSEKPPVTASGYLYFGVGNYLGVFSLATGEATPATHLGELRIDKVSDYHDGELLISVSSLDSVRSRARVLRYKPSDNHTREFLVGSSALYVPQRELVLFTMDGDLAAVMRDAINVPARQIHQRDHRNPMTVLAIGNTSILVGYSEDGEPLIYRIDLATGQSEALATLADQCVLASALWLPDQDKLLCKSPTGNDAFNPYRFISLEGQIGSSLPLPEGRDFRAMAYLPGQKRMVFSEAWTSWFGGQPKRAVWIHNPESGESSRLVANQPLGSSVVHRKHKY